MGAQQVPVFPTKDQGELAVQKRFRVDAALNARIRQAVRDTGMVESDVLRYLVKAGLDQWDAERRKR